MDIADLGMSCLELPRMTTGERKTSKKGPAAWRGLVVLYCTNSERLFCVVIVLISFSYEVNMLIPERGHYLERRTVWLIQREKQRKRKLLRNI